MSIPPSPLEHLDDDLEPQFNAQPELPLALFNQDESLKVDHPPGSGVIEHISPLEVSLEESTSSKLKNMIKRFLAWIIWLCIKCTVMLYLIFMISLEYKPLHPFYEKYLPLATVQRALLVNRWLKDQYITHFSEPEPYSVKELLQQSTLLLREECALKNRLDLHIQNLIKSAHQSVDATKRFQTQMNLFQKEIRTFKKKDLQKLKKYLSKSLEIRIGELHHKRSKYNSQTLLNKYDQYIRDLSKLQDETLDQLLKNLSGIYSTLDQLSTHSDDWISAFKDLIEMEPDAQSALTYIHSTIAEEWVSINQSLDKICLPTPPVTSLPSTKDPL